MTGLLPPGLLIFLASAFALPSEAAFSLIFYLCVLPAAATCWRMLGARGAGEKLAMALILWSGLTLFWGEDNGNRSAGLLLGTVCTGVFVLSLRHVLEDPAWRRLLITVLIWAATTNAACVLLFNVPALLDGQRILGWGVTRQPILGGSVMALAGITALFRARHGGAQGAGPVGAACSRCEPFAYLAAAGVMAVFVVAMQSRGALLGFAGAGLVLVWHIRRWGGLMACVIVLKAFLVGAPARLRDPVLASLLNRGTSHRPEIWARSWALIRQKPWFGHGLAATLPISPTGFPHSLYLSLLFYSGAVGFALFAGMMIAVSGRWLRARPGSERIWVSALLANALLAGLTDFGQITKGPGPLWLIFWLPIVLVLSLPLSPRAADAALPGGAS